MTEALARTVYINPDASLTKLTGITDQWIIETQK